LLLEKAWAKLHGSYKRIEAGLPYSTLRDLTGAPAYHYNLNDTPNIWEIFYENDAKNYVFALGTTGRDEGKGNMQGLIPGHAYALIKVAIVKDK
jgi:calpain-15